MSQTLTNLLAHLVFSTKNRRHIITPEIEPELFAYIGGILKSRGTPSGARESTEGAIERVEEGTAALARSVYDRGSLSSHKTMTRTEVFQLKRYVEAVLAELLQVH